MKTEPHSTYTVSTDRFIGALCIVAGTAIGAAMLALPVVMGRAGFIPSILSFLGAWVFMAYSALLFLELCTTYRHGTNIISLAQSTLGKIGTIGASSAYLLLLYSLLTAYIAGLSQIAMSTLGNVIKFDIPQEVAAGVLFVIAIALFTKGMKLVDNINRILLIGVIVSFVFLIGASFGNFQGENLKVMRWQYLLPSLSIGFTSFGFHVVIPSLANYLGYHSRALVKVLLLGSFLPLLAYATWQAICLFQIPMSGSIISIDGAYERGISGAELLSEVYQSSTIRLFSDLFAVTAIATSFLGVALSMVDFVQDGLKQMGVFYRQGSKHSRWMKYLVLIIAFIPPTWFSSTSPHIFFTALEIAGVFGVVLLLAFFPACMVYKKRYGIPMWLQKIGIKNGGVPELSEVQKETYKAPGGKIFLSLYIAFSAFMVLGEALKMAIR